MAIRNIRKHDDFLRGKSRPVTVFDARLHQLLDDMAETMASVNGVGLAAVQVGVLRRAVVIDVGDGVTELINPSITAQSDNELCEREGCLSYPGEWGMVNRPGSLTVTAMDRNGDMFTLECEGLFARAVCHEVDHLNGVIFKDLATEMVDADEDDKE